MKDFFDFHKQNEIISTVIYTYIYTHTYTYVYMFIFDTLRQPNIDHRTN